MLRLLRCITEATMIPWHCSASLFGAHGEWSHSNLFPSNAGKKKVGIRMSALPHWKLLATAMMLSLIYGLSSLGEAEEQKVILLVYAGPFPPGTQSKMRSDVCVVSTVPSSHQLLIFLPVLLQSDSEAREAALPISNPLTCCRDLPRALLPAPPWLMA